jgi:hypothetical protein
LLCLAVLPGQCRLPNSKLFSPRTLREGLLSHFHSLGSSGFFRQQGTKRAEIGALAAKWEEVIADYPLFGWLAVATSGRKTSLVMGLIRQTCLTAIK